MANTFKLNTKAGGAVAANTDITVLTASTTTILIGLTISNKVNNSITVDVKLESSTSGNANVNIGQNLPIPSGSSLDALAGKIVMNTGDILKVQSDTANSVDIVLSTMEIA
ncbi:MAG: hypothetical protein QGH83_15585 [Candidatus Pacebacteria bacterium]|jgi:hypothetical protein|nr:hypothetical protein [Candidatus Paceibacterota bacterium]|tara:strand:- start:272 stop:604 length:333 start_codon:yes stop_codon:yes gene_type:complete